MSSPNQTSLRECVRPGHGCHLFAQESHGEIRIVDPWKMTGKKPFLETWEPGHPRNNPPSPAKILAVYTTENPTKMDCLRTLLKDIVYLKVPEFLHMPEKHLLKEAKYKTSESEKNVGKQPFTPYGQLGNLYRIQEAQDKLLKELKGGPKGPNKLKDELEDYLAIFILSIESDIDDKRDGPPGAVPHDQPNMMIYECFSGDYISGVGRGPGVQKDILDIVKGLGFEDENGPKLAGKVEYGWQLTNMFSTDGQPIDASDWHRTVTCGKQSREDYFKDLREKILSVAKDKLLQELDTASAFHFYLPDSKLLNEPTMYPC